MNRPLDLRRQRLRLLPAALAAVLCLAALAPSSASAGTLFPRPAELEKDVAFWERIYSSVGTDGGLVHDSRDLGIVYHQIRFPEGTSRRARERQVEGQKDEVVKTLKKLARGVRSGLSAEERRILALFPDGVKAATLKAAAKHVRFQLGQADKFRAGIIRSGAWADYIRDTFREMGLPVQLAALPHVESSFTPNVYSRVGAAGLWQFTRSTGRRYMRVDHVVDERMDPFHSTRAAGRLLEANKLITGTWPLALTAYNHGAAGMRRASRKLGTTDIATIARKYKSRSFGFASRNFYVEFLAALEVSSNATRYFGPLTLDTPVEYEESELPYHARASQVAGALGVSSERLRELNPALTRLVWNGEKFIPRGFSLRMPRTQLARPLAEMLAALPADQRFAAQTPDSTHKVRRGDTLSGIAARYGTTVRAIASVNKLRSRNHLRVGQKLRLPYSGKTPRAALPALASADGTYRVRRGDTISKIASRFGMSQRELTQLNQISNRNRIYPGQSLRVSSSAPAAPADPPSQPPSKPSAVAKAATPEPVVVAAARPLPEAAPPPITRAPDVIAPAPTRPTAAREPAPEPVVVAKAQPAAASRADREDLDRLAEDASRPAGLLEEGELRRDLIADPSDYSVAANDTIEVQAAETLGHIADWLDVRASDLRRLNGLRYGTPIGVHQRLKVSFGKIDRPEFERRRLEHHRGLQAEFFERYEISGTRSHVVRRGDSIWVLSKRTQVPVWLLRQYNPDLDFGALHAGAKLTLPIVRPHKLAG